jgi:SAM-dependent methyltransferase
MPLVDYHEQFAAVYDALYANRDVVADTRYAAGLLELDAHSKPDAHVLDFGCGSGSHVLALGRLGIAATGFDTSPAMIARALAKPASRPSADVRFVAGAFTDFCAALNGQCFDGAISLFQVFNCMESPGEMLAHLRLIRDRLAVGARFLIDLWNGVAVFTDDPRPDASSFVCPDEPSKEIVRITIPQLDRINQRCTLHYRILTLDGTRRREQGGFESVHQITFLTPVQYRHLFELAGLRIIDEFRRGHPGTPITERDWYISYLLGRDS